MEAALTGTLADGAGIGSGQRSPFLDAIEIFAVAISLLDRPACAFAQHLIEPTAPREVNPASFSHPRGNRAIEHVRDRRKVRSHLCHVEIGCEEPYAATDVVTDATRRNHAVVGAHCRNAPDREAVAPVDVRHCEALPHDSRKGGNVGDLFDCLVLRDRREERLIGIDEPWHPHAWLVGGRDLPTIWIDPAQHTCLERWSSLHGSVTSTLCRRRDPGYPAIA